MNVIYKLAETDEEFEQARELFTEYANSLDIDLSFQNFTKELESVRQQYYQPTGALLLVYKDIQLAGCAGIRRLDDDTSELKRMYVRPDFRGFGLGKKLLDRAIATAAALGYKKIRLDTLSSMTKARNLYESSGFEPIDPYYFNPIEDTIYMERVI
ncbi:GNAT family N-acetyltransferase [Dyadobacter fanqingshengii]|uniref:GNAT family N-acetyltransferase n=1 Tax=Dyadobacter fanqingshengii TaxID=2906443 RepID=A0A9X1P845_9BACT|nr:GNAT family N-acetyltransferase [Dyadobacter fanqingshengii]MCF0040501.1 GNAT family N-acetyltransferase [Dyadobacter fanqingshengii]MCF2501894.1 GNAT family N-acetyltransferase [Dyadobacter fanqingshengii]USJ37757.1 GNAT family N-acetyltransferase [Dyadobacter fanqingshengii]